MPGLPATSLAPATPAGAGGWPLPASGAEAFARDRLDTGQALGRGLADWPEDAALDAAVTTIGLDRPLEPLGQFRHTFILAVDDEGIVIVDQHVAHERVLFERILEQDSTTYSTGWHRFSAGQWPEASLGTSCRCIVHIILLLNVVAVGRPRLHLDGAQGRGRIQDRLGPTRVGGKFGWLQTLADGIKLIAKEDITPKDADPLLFKLAPYVSFCAPASRRIMALPFANGWAAQEMNVAVFFIVAVLGLEVFGVILAGYASGSKWSLFGGMREAAQVVSYEVPIGLCVVVPVLIAGSMNLVDDRRGCRPAGSRTG